MTDAPRERRAPRRRSRTLLGVLVVVSAGAIGLELWKPMTPAERPVLGVTAADVRAIHVREGERELRATRTADGWRIESPPGAGPGSGETVEAMVATLVSMVALDEFVRPELDRRTIGLEPPRVVVELTVRGRETAMELRLGDYTPTGGSVYGALTSDPRILQVGAAIAGEVERALYRVSLEDRG
jgi:hypothetical protein